MVAAGIGWLDLRRPEFDTDGLSEDRDHDGHPLSVRFNPQDFALPACVGAADHSNPVARLQTHWHYLTREFAPSLCFNLVFSDEH